MAIFKYLSDNPETANAVVAAIGVLVALFALWVSVYSNRTARKSLEIQHRHNVLSVRPIPEITIADYENSLRVRLRNNGMGTLIVENSWFETSERWESALVYMMPRLPPNRPWNHFTSDIAGRTIQPGKYLHLLELTKNENELEFGKTRDLVRASLKDITITVQYTDVYETHFPYYIKNLSWFGRNL